MDKCFAQARRASLLWHVTSILPIIGVSQVVVGSQIQALITVVCGVWSFSPGLLFRLSSGCSVPARSERMASIGG
ncbi:hypothetical protein F5X98DRAFT_327987 [Xylaria grammica]|nr:hypothetical protein F5X98DRAFT_327987 [Xylaria grammica]